jgi:hypothetical protein
MVWDLEALIAYVRENPLLGLGCVGGIAIVVYLLQRKPVIQRDADERLASLRKENAGRYDRLHPLD